MKTKLLITLLILPVLLFPAVYVPGSHNSFALDATSEATLKSNFGGGTNYYGYTLQPSVDGGFKVVDGSWGTDWGGGYWITAYDQRWTPSYNGADAVWKGSPNTYVHICIQDPATFHSTNLPLGIMTLSASPISISSVSDNSGSGVPNTSITVSITLSGSKSAEENVYIRYSSDGWSTDNWVLATGSGTSYSGDISTSGSGTVSYYVLTTTLTSTGSGDLDTYPDLCTIAYDNNGGSNYSFGYDSSLPVSLSKFSGQSMNGFVQLDWSTDSEIENLGFNVYRSLADNPLELLASFTNTKSLEGYGSTNNYHEYTYSDNRVTAGETYRYVLADVDYNGVEKRHDDHAVTLTYAPGADEIKPVKFALSGAYPNPFNPSTTIQYTVPEAGDVAFTIYDLSGRELWSANEITTSAGRHQLNWAGLNTNGHLLPSGLYIVQMRAGIFQATQKLSLVR